jgi:hypothetical protein
LLKPDTEEDFKANVYPNPFSKNVAIKIRAITSGKFIIRLTTISGQHVVAHSTYLPVGMTTINIKTPEQLQPGIYILSMVDKNGAVVSVTRVEKKL